MKYSKLILKISLVMIGFGIILYSIGFFMGGELSKINNNFISIISDDSNRIIQTKKLTDFNNVDIDVDLDYIELIKSDVNKIELNYNENLSEVTYEVKDNNLLINQPKTNTMGVHFNINGFNNKNSNYMKLYINESSTLKKININSSDSDMKISNLDSDILDVKCNYGDVSIDNLISDNINIIMNDGDINIDNTNSYTLFNIKNNYGDINILNSNFNSFIANLNNGSLDISNSSSKNSEIENKYGDITSIEFLSEGITINSNSGDINLKGSLLGDTILNNKYGDIKIISSEDENSYNYSVVNKYGDVSIADNTFEGSFTKDNNSKHSININCNAGDVNLNFKN